MNIPNSTYLPITRPILCKVTGDGQIRTGVRKPDWKVWHRNNLDANNHNAYLNHTWYPAWQQAFRCLLITEEPYFVVFLSCGKPVLIRYGTDLDRMKPSADITFIITMFMNFLANFRLIRARKNGLKKSALNSRKEKIYSFRVFKICDVDGEDRIVRDVLWAVLNSAHDGER